MIAYRNHDRFFARALVISLLFHLSAVTLFRIVFNFPHKDIQYFNVSIQQTAAAERGKLTVAGPNFDANAAPPPALPDIQLPALSFQELSKIPMRREALQTRSRLDEFFAGTIEDPWARATSRIGALGQTLSRLTFGPSNPKTPAPTPVSRPAPGFEAYIDWTSEPLDRKVLTVVPIDKFWGLAPSALPEPVTLVFNVNRDGKVVRIVVFSPVNDPDHYADASAEALKEYRFEPLLGDGPATQSGTFVVRAATPDTP